MLRNRIVKYFFIWFFIFQFNYSFSQVVNIENKRIYDDTAGVSGSLDASLSAMKTKDLLVNLAFRPKIQYKTVKHYYLFLSDLMYSKGSEKVFSNSGMTHFRYAYRIKGPLKWESYAQAQYNQLLDQRMRALVGTGLRLKFLDTNGYKLFAGLSTFYEYEEIQSTHNLITDIRSSNYVSWFIDPKTNFTFSGVLYYQPLWNNFRDFRLMGQYTLSFHFTKRTDFRLEVSNFYDASPVSGVLKSTFNSSFGVRMKLGE